MADHELAQPDRQLLGAVARLAGVDRVWVTDETLHGESRSTFAVAAGDDEFVVKLVPAARRAIDNQRRLVRMVRDLRRRASPRPSTSAWGNPGGTIFTLQRRLPGQPLHRGAGQRRPRACSPRCSPAFSPPSSCSATQAIWPEPPWPAWLLDTIEAGGNGYCLHATMCQAPARPRCSAVCSRWPGATSGTRPGRGTSCTST